MEKNMDTGLRRGGVLQGLYAGTSTTRIGR